MTVLEETFVSVNLSPPIAHFGTDFNTGEVMVITSPFVFVWLEVKLALHQFMSLGESRFEDDLKPCVDSLYCTDYIFVPIKVVFNHLACFGQAEI